MLPLTHKGFWLAASALLVAGVVYGSLSPAPALPVPGNFDKVEHFSTYLFLALWFTALYSRPRYWLVVVALLALGLTMEVMQHVMALGRFADPCAPSAARCTLHPARSAVHQTTFPRYQFDPTRSPSCTPVGSRSSSPHR